MSLAKLLGMRPKADTAAALRASLAEAEAARGAAVHRIAELQRDRGARLLDSDPAAVETAERDLAAMRGDVERLDALLPVLRDRIETAQQREMRGTAERLTVDANRQCEAFKNWFRTEYEPAARKLAAGFAMEVAAREAVERAQAALQAAGVHAEGLPRLPPLPAGELWPQSIAGLYGIGANVSLPPLDGPVEPGRPGYWPPGPGAPGSWAPGS